MTNNKFALSLSGFGYLTDIKRTLQGMTIKVKVFSASSDDIELECIVDTQLVDRLNNLILACRVGEYVVLQFIARYTQFSHSHVGLTQQDPQQMVQLKCRLREFEGWLRDGDLPLPTAPDEI